MAKIYLNLCILCLASIPTLAVATTYYVAVEGNDKHDGLTWETAWRTPKKAAESIIAGDLVLVRKGDRPYIGFVINRSGKEGKPITFRGELPNDPPIITGGIKERRWEKATTAGIWMIKTTSKPNFLIEDGKTLLPASTTKCEDGSWYWDNNRIYYRPSSGSPDKHDTWRQALGGGIGISNQSWIVIENFHIWFGLGGGIGIRGEKGSHNQVRNVHIEWHFRGVDIRDGANNNTVEECLVEHNRDGIYLSGGASNNVIRNCKAISNGNTPYWNKSDRAGIAIGEYGVNPNNVLEANEVAYNGGPLSDPGMIVYQAPGSLLHDNYIHDNYGSGLLITIRSDGSIAENNRVENNGAQAQRDGQKGDVGLGVRRSKNVTVANNSIIGNYVSRDSPRKGDEGPRGGLELRGIHSDDMSGIKFINNRVYGTIGGPDIYIHPSPNTAGLIIEPKSQQPKWLKRRINE